MLGYAYTVNGRHRKKEFEFRTVKKLSVSSSTELPIRSLQVHIQSERSLCHSRTKFFSNDNRNLGDAMTHWEENGPYTFEATFELARAMCEIPIENKCHTDQFRVDYVKCIRGGINQKRTKWTSEQ